MRFALVLLVGLGMSSYAKAGAPVHSPVQWSVKGAPTKAVKAGAKFDMMLQGQIEPGWHVYAMEEPEGGPIATQINLAEDDAADIERVNEDKPKIIQDAVFGKTLGLFEGEAGFTLHLQMERGAAAGLHVLHVLVRYQSCSDRVCLPPHTETVEVPVSVVR
jgi:thiol:disulfide interchange protein DsbD